MKPEKRIIKYSNAVEVHFTGDRMEGRFITETPTEKARKAFPALVKAYPNEVIRAHKLMLKALMLVSSIDERKYNFETQLKFIQLQRALCEVCDDIALIKKSRGIM